MIKPIDATPAAIGFDANTKITKSSAKALANAGMTFAVRYVSRNTKNASKDLDASETDIILDAGLALMAVQHVESEGWTPTRTLGATYGANAAAHAAAAALPKGVSVFLDLEGVGSGAPTADILDYCNAWYEKVAAAGYFPGIYVGANCGLDGDDLFYRLKFKSYWKSGSKVPDIPVRGYSMLQTIKPGEKVGGVEIDRNVIVTDSLGGIPVWAVAESVAAPAANAATVPAAGTHSAVALSLTAPSLDETALLEMGDSAGVSVAMIRLLERRRTLTPNSMPRFWAIVNFNLHSSLPRLFVFDKKLQTFASYLCAHGDGSEGDSDDGYANVFSNNSGSHMSSLGIYRCAEPYIGSHGRSLRLDGIDPTNSHARPRAIVIHGANYVSPEMIAATGRIGRSNGCPAVENKHAALIVDALSFGSYLMVWHASLA